MVGFGGPCARAVLGWVWRFLCQGSATVMFGGPCAKAVPQWGLEVPVPGLCHGGVWGSLCQGCATIRFGGPCARTVSW